MTERRIIPINIAGQTYKVTSTADEAQLERISAVVSNKMAELVAPGKPIPPQAFLLVALSLAHDLELERTKRQGIEQQTREALQRMLVRIDDALEQQPKPPLATPVRSETLFPLDGAN